MPFTLFALSFFLQLLGCFQNYFLKAEKSKNTANHNIKDLEWFDLPVGIQVFIHPLMSLILSLSLVSLLNKAFLVLEI